MLRASQKPTLCFYGQDGWSALHFGAWAGRVKVVQELLQYGADVHLQDKVCQAKFRSTSGLSDQQ